VLDYIFITHLIVRCHIVEWIKVAQNRNQKRDLDNEKEMSVSTPAQTILALNHESLSHVIQGKNGNLQLFALVI